MGLYLQILVGIAVIASIVGAAFWAAGCVVHFRIQKFRHPESQASTILVWELSEYLAPGHSDVRRSKWLMKWGSAMFFSGYVLLNLVMALHLWLLE